jgi:hypothetical protein
LSMSERATSVSFSTSQEVPVEPVAIRIDEVEPVVVAIHQRDSAPESPEEVGAQVEQRLDDCVRAGNRWEEAASHAVARGERGLVRIARGDDRRDSGETQGADQVHAPQEETGGRSGERAAKSTWVAGTMAGLWGCASTIEALEYGIAEARGAARGPFGPSRGAWSERMDL